LCTTSHITRIWPCKPWVCWHYYNSNFYWVFLSKNTQIDKCI
jgi:hypothetical protein